MSAGSTASATAATAHDSTSYNPEKDSVILGGLFQTIINDLRGSSPIWEDFTYKSVKLHASLKTTVVAVGAFLEAFQKVADMATSSKGATREIGSALTRLCMRHRSIESHLKTLTSSILDNLVAPLQDKLEDWKKAVAQIDKDHSRENKKAKQEIKKAASDTIRLQKKVRKGSTHGKSDMQQKLDSAMMDVNSKYHQLEETEKNAVRSALIEERSRFCLFITCLKPFVDQELKLLTEMTHFNEIMENLCLQASEPSVLPASSEQVILDLKGVDTATFSFTQGSDSQEHDDCDSTPTTPSDNTPSASSTWNNWPNMPGNHRIDQGRPHTISSTYEKGHVRPALKPDIFEPPQETVEMRLKTMRSQSHSGRENRPSATISKLQPVLPPHCPKPKIKAVAPPMLPPGAQPIYANMSDLAQRGSQPDLSPDDGEPTTPTTPASTSVSLIQQNTSLELAKAIRELEVSTAALTSAYDSDTYATVGNHTAVTSSTTATCDTDSYTSKMSLQCSSGYGTMNSTPAGSEDTIASGGVTEGITESALYEELEEVVGEGIPVAGIVRKGSMSSQKPPPPVRRTASVSGVPPYLLVSGDKQASPDGHDPSYAVGGGEGLVESPYAELQVIQQSIHDQTRSQQVSVTAPKLVQYQRQASGGDHPRPVQPDGSLHDAGGRGQFASPQHGATATAIQSLNAKFASLNNQYRDEHGSDAVDGSTHGGNTRGPVQKTIPQVMHKPSKNAFPPPPSATVGHADQHQHIPPNHGGSSGPFQAGNPQHRMKHPGHHPPHQQLQHQLSRQLHQQKQHQQQGLYLESNSYQQQYGHVLSAHPEEDFPLPPTQEELQEMEIVYNRQAAAGQAIGTPGQRLKQMRQVSQAAPTHQLPLQHHQMQHQPQPQVQHYHQQHRQQQHQLHQHQLHQQQLQQHQQLQQQQHHHQLQQQQQQHPSQQQRHQLQQSQDVQASLMLELKKRVSIDESSEA